MEITAIIIDDEKSSREALAEKILKSAPEVKIIHQSSNAVDGMVAIKNLQPDLVFLDIEMPLMNGFKMLEAIGDINFEVIFTTAYNQYAINAIRYSALDYLLKPIDQKELAEAVENYKKRKEKTHHHYSNNQIELLLQQVKLATPTPPRIALPTADGLQMMDIDEIIRLKSDGAYTMFYIANGKNIFVSRSIKEYEELLENHGFFRIHNSHIVNLRLISKYVKGEGGYVVMSDGSSVEVSVRRKQAFLQKLTK